MSTDRSAAGFEALGDGTRRAIVARLAVSQHLRVLKEAGLVTERVSGTRRIYRLDPGAVAALRDQLDTFWSRALAGYARSAEHTPQETQ